MKKNHLERQAFRAGLIFEIDRLGFGGQAELSRRSGISRSMVNDILSGRTFGKLKTREALAKALNHPDYASLLEYGKKVAEELDASSRPEANLVGSYLNPPNLDLLLLENRALRIENDKLKSQLKKYKKLLSAAHPDAEEFMEPSGDVKDFGEPKANEPSEPVSFKPASKEPEDEDPDNPEFPELKGAVK
jgi:transcriptional regulator with XRE-family HTH domain